MIGRRLTSFVRASRKRRHRICGVAGIGGSRTASAKRGNERGAVVVGTALIAPRRPRSERGAVVVETALIAPFLFFLIFMIIETGPLFMLWSSTKHSAQEGARMATVAGQTSTADYSILKAMAAPLVPVGNRLDYVIVFVGKDTLLVPDLDVVLVRHGATPATLKDNLRAFIGEAAAAIRSATT